MDAEKRRSRSEIKFEFMANKCCRMLTKVENEKVKGGILPVLLVLTIDAVLLGTMGGYIYESFTSDH